MMADRMITIIVKPHLHNSHERITHVGNGSSGWLITVEQTIAKIDSGEDRFYVVDSKTGRRADVCVRRLYGRTAFIQSYFDGDWSNHLLSLPRAEVPAASVRTAEERAVNF
jgi:hypothetical protein